jgi:hypothetical protein
MSVNWSLIAETLSQLMTEVKQIKKTLRDKDTGALLDSAEPEPPINFGHPLGVGPGGALVQYVSIVRSLYEADGYITCARAMPTTGSNTFWQADPRLPVVNVKLPASVGAPEIGDTVLITFTGVVQNEPVYGLFGAAGDSVVPCLVQSVGNDYLICKTYVDSTLGDDDLYVAKPFKLRRSPFHGETINSLSYSYLSPIARTVSHASTPTWVMTQTVVPAYTLNFDIIYAISSSKIGMVTEAGSDIKYLDINADARQWARLP